eukprot:TRINITY_DN16959_c0_g1_i6.p1 TRINITY_DN16959_c0_g1~~TRINITY_DN16959_c0_g1_i6.p1  ORF type:complete len:151 (+),score=37.17 TRINITY_DN16959_c0_g1_i6:146-598(+)
MLQIKMRAGKLRETFNEEQLKEIEVIMTDALKRFHLHYYSEIGLLKCIFSNPKVAREIKKLTKHAKSKEHSVQSSEDTEQEKTIVYKSKRLGMKSKKLKKETYEESEDTAEMNGSNYQTFSENSEGSSHGSDIRKHPNRRPIKNSKRQEA